ncbi:MFS transporter [Streptomyces hoynatensis]|uniref:MFS transporter n=1 Tax=Streptomyces hoynatensis TaxID=1141874 RepID=A0A3A9YJ62_9ACTN|nr:MFS transporter [Streptomyces hoynatensis]
MLAIVLIGQFMALLDVFIVNVAAPTVQADLGATGGQLQLVISGYTISYAVLLITGARLGGRYGPGRLFLAGLALFTAASLACGLATSTGQLIAFRFIQGAGSATMLPQVLSLIQRTFSGSARQRALALFGGVLAVGAAAGQIVGGVLINADLFGWDWRPVFLVNLPIGLLLLAFGSRALPLQRPAGAERSRSLDFPGLSLLTAAVVLFTVPLVLGQEEDWPAWCFVSLAASALFVALFAVFETRLAGRGGSPLISPRVLRSPGMPTAAVRVFLSMAINAGILFAFSLHIQGPKAAEGLDYGALSAGLSFLPTAITFGSISLSWRFLPPRSHAALAPLGFAISAVAMLSLGLLLRDADGLTPAILLLFGVNGLGLGLAYSPTLARSLASVKPEYAGDASGLTAMMTQLGMLVGIATFGTLFLNRAEGALSTAQGIETTLFALAATAAVGALTGAAARVKTR